MNRPEHGGILSRLLAILVLASLALAIYVARRPILRFAGEFWVVEDSLAPSDAIIVLSDDNYSGDRAARAAQLYRMGLAPRVVASGKMLRPYAGIAELIARDLQSDGVPAAAIVVFPQRAGNTREEAVALRTLVAQRGWRRILVVTSNYHTRRSRFILHKVIPPGVTVRIAAAPDSQYDPAHWWQSRRGVKLFFHEAVGYLVARWELRNSPSAQILARAAAVTASFCKSYEAAATAARPMRNAQHCWLCGNLLALNVKVFSVYSPCRLYYILRPIVLSELSLGCP